MRPGFRRPRPRWRRQAAAWHAHIVHVASRVDDVVLVLACIGGVALLVVALYVLGV